MLKSRCALYTCLFLGFMAGCSQNNPQAPATISGRVHYKGNPLPAGNIVFHTADKVAYPCALSSDGTYEVRDIPIGEMKVTVETESVNPSKKGPGYGKDKGAEDYQKRLEAEGPGGAAKAPPQQYVAIPKNYNSSATTPLTVTIINGRNVQEFTLKDE